MLATWEEKEERTEFVGIAGYLDPEEARCVMSDLIGRLLESSPLIIIVCIIVWWALTNMHDPVSRFARSYAEIYWWDSKKKKQEKLDRCLKMMHDDAVSDSEREE